jgi:predicted peptidase
MKFDSYDAVFKFTAHPAIIINQNLTPGFKAKDVAVTGNTIATTQGFEPIVAIGNNISIQDNKLETIKEKQNIIIDGTKPSKYNYTLLDDNDLFVKGNYTDRHGSVLNYQFMEPKYADDGKKYPLVIVLHDKTSIGGGDKDHLRHFVWQLAEERNLKKYPCYVLAPHMEEGEKQWKALYNFSDTWKLKAISEMIDKMAAEHDIDKDRVYVFGLGIGGGGAMDIGVNHPDKFAAIVSMGGFFRFHKHAAKELSKVPIWILWGEKDAISRNNRQFMVMDLKSNGAKLKTSYVPDTGRKCWNNIEESIPELLPWVFSQRR